MVELEQDEVPQISLEEYLIKHKQGKPYGYTDIWAEILRNESNIYFMDVCPRQREQTYPKVQFLFELKTWKTSARNIKKAGVAGME